MRRMALVLLAAACCACPAFPAVTVDSERLDDRGEWAFKTILRPSRSDAARESKIFVTGSEKEMSSLSLDGLHNGVLPWRGINKRDFFSFSNFDPKDGRIVMDLGRSMPIVAVASYSWQEKFNHLDGTRSPQVYTLYGSAAAKLDTGDLSTWTRIAEVDTRQNGWGGQHGAVVREGGGGVLGIYRWLLWDVRHVRQGQAPNQTPNLGNTWYTEFDVHTADTLPRAGDAIKAGTDLEGLTLAFKTHFDIGFTHRAPEIVNLYRTSMIDRALGLIDASRKLPPDQRFAWTISSWVMHQILWEGQDPVRRARVVQAMKEGSLVIHALPVTLQTESLDLETLASGLALHTRIAREVGIPLSRAGKMTDVPSHSWILPTLLKNAGIDFMHIGCNPCNERPDVPLLYNWEGPDGSRLLTFHNQGYGSDIVQGLSGLYPPKDWPYRHWLALCCGCDNTPPPSEGEVKSLFGELRRNLPQVNVKIGRMEDFADAIMAEEKAGASVPVLRADMPDCWIHGMGTLPAMEALAHQVRPGLCSVESLDSHLRMWGLPRPDISKKLAAAQERSLMYGEHTWGGARNLQGRNAYADKDFEKTIETDGTCKYLQQTWDDHADYIRKAAGISSKLQERELAQLAAAVNIEGDRMVVFNPLPCIRDATVDVPGGGQVLVTNLPPSGYRAIPLPVVTSASPVTCETAVLENACLKVTLDRGRGGIVSVWDKTTGRDLVDARAKYAFGQFVYQRFDRRQSFEYDQRCSHLDSIYGRCTGWNVRADLPDNVPHVEAAPSYEKMTVSRDAEAQKAELTAPAAGIIAARVTMTITLPAGASWMEIAVRLDDKKPDYWPEDGGLYFAVKADKPQFRIGRLGGVVDPAKDFARNSNRTYGYVNTGAMVADADGAGVAICPLDHGIMSFGDKGIYTIDPDYVPTTPIARVSMFNNLWTINFPYWIRGTVSSRVRVWPTRDLNAASLVEPSLDARQPVLVAMGTGSAGSLPAEQSGLALSRPGIRITAFRQDQDGTLLRVWEQSGVSGELTVTLPAGAGFTSALPVNLRGERLGEPITIRSGVFAFRLGSYAPASFLLTPRLPVAAPAAAAGPRKTLRLAEGDLSGISQGWGTPQRNVSAIGAPLRIGGESYSSGIGTHASMEWDIELGGQGISFSALVGMQDLGEKGKGSVEFLVLGDGKPLFKSGILRSGDKAVPVRVDLAGVDQLTLKVTDAGDGNSADHADWIEPELVYTGTLE